MPSRQRCLESWRQRRPNKTHRRTNRHAQRDVPRLQYPMLADAVVVVHFLIVLFVLAGVPLVYLGVALHWAWVRRWHWRVLHLGAILFIASESLLGIACPLTVWEYDLRGQQSTHGFIERWVDGIL